MAAAESGLRIVELHDRMCECVRQLMLAYRSALLDAGVPIDDFQGYTEEIDALPGKYAEAAGGTVLLAVDVTDPAGGGISAESTTTSASSSESGHMHSESPTLDAVTGGTHGTASDGQVHPKHCAHPGLAVGVVAVKAIALPDGFGYVEGSAPERPCEMKRLFVAPTARGRGIGRLLALSAMSAARSAGHSHMFLDTLHRLAGAEALYARIGFVRVGAYVHNPMPDVVFMARRL